MNQQKPNSKLRVLIVEDDPQVAQLMRLYLERDGHFVMVAPNGAEGLEMARSEKPSIILLDLMLPEMDGREVCRRIRLQSQVPIIMVTARVEEHDKLKGLGLGADDYMTKPFSPNELVARVYAVMRRVEQNYDEVNDDEPGAMRFGNLTISAEQKDALVDGELVNLNQTEFDLLTALAGSPDITLTRDHLVSMLPTGNGTAETNGRTLDVHLSNIRQKIGKNEAQEARIKAVYGVGYKFVP